MDNKSQITITLRNEPLLTTTDFLNRTGISNDIDLLTTTDFLNRTGISNFQMRTTVTVYLFKLESLSHTILPSKQR